MTFHACASTELMNAVTGRVRRVCLRVRQKEESEVQKKLQSESKDIERSLLQRATLMRRRVRSHTFSLSPLSLLARASDAVARRERAS